MREFGGICPQGKTTPGAHQEKDTAASTDRLVAGEQNLCRLLQHSAVDPSELCESLAGQLPVEGRASRLELRQPWIIARYQRINWSESRKTLELDIVYS